MRRSIRACCLGLTLFVPLVRSQRLSEEEAAKAIDLARQKALAYAKSLPDFVCTETVRRYMDTRNRGAWLLLDKLTVKLSYFGQKEDHKLISVNDQPATQAFETLGGAIGRGEFGATLHSIFDPVSQAAFRWQSTKTVRKHRVAVFAYDVDVTHSRYVLATGTHEDLHEAVVGYKGQLEIDIETGEVLQFTYDAEQIPKSLEVSYARTKVDYEYANVGGREYLLPARSETEMRGAKLNLRNQMEFRDYSKFSTDSTISFDPGK